MGYFGNGFVFTTAPASGAISDLFPETVGLRLYRHRLQEVWFLDAWSLRTREHWPFSDALEEELPLAPLLPEDTAHILETFRSACQCLPGSETPYGTGWLRMSAQLSVALSVPTFFFAADDELTDMACRASQGHLQAFAVRFGACAVEYVEGRLTVVPFGLPEDPDIELSEDRLDALSRVPGVSLLARRVIDGGMPLYGNAVHLWPIGDPANLLGVGTWDPFDKVSSELDVLFERVPTPPAPRPVPAPRYSRQELSPTPKRPWWRIWQ